MAAQDRQSKHRPVPMRTGGDDGHTRGGGVPAVAPTGGRVERGVERGPRGTGNRGGHYQDLGETNKERRTDVFETFFHHVYEFLTAAIVISSPVPTTSSSTRYSCYFFQSCGFFATADTSTSIT